MRATCDHAFRMGRMIQIRNVSEEIHRKLKIRAAREGVTLSELLAREARRLADQPTPDEMRERLLSRPRVKLSIPPARVVRAGREGR